MGTGNSSQEPDILRIKYGFWIVVIGFAMVLLALASVVTQNRPMMVT
jgi:uncharacterized membrane protein